MPKIVQYNSNMEAVIAVMQERIEEKRLSKEQAFYYERILIADDLFRQHQHMNKCAKMLNAKIQKIISDRELPYTYSERTALNDIRDTQIIIGTTSKYNREYNVGVLMEEIGQAIQMAKILKDVKSLVAAIKEKSNAILRFMGDSETLRMEDLEIGETIISIDLKKLGYSPKSEKDLEKQLEKLLAKNGVEDIAYTPIHNGKNPS